MTQNKPILIHVGYYCTCTHYKESKAFFQKSNKISKPKEKQMVMNIFIAKEYTSTCMVVFVPGLPPCSLLQQTYFLHSSISNTQDVLDHNLGFSWNKIRKNVTTT